MGAHGVEAILVSGVGDGVLTAIRGGESEASVGPLSSQTTLAGLDAVSGFVTATQQHHHYTFSLKFNADLNEL